MTTATMTAPAWTPAFGAGPMDPGADNGRIIDVYQYAIRHGVIDTAALDLVAVELGVSVFEVFCAATRLVELHLLRTDEQGGAALLPMDAQSAAALVVSPIERAIFQQRELADRLRERIESIAGPQGGAAGPLGTVGEVEGVAEIRGLLKLAAASCRSEAAVLRAGHAEDPAVEELFAACFGALDPETPVRVIGPHRDRADFASRARIKQLAERPGTAVRTIRAVPQTAVVLDRSLAVLIELPDGDGSVPTARLVKDPTTVRFLVDLFDLLWEDATVFAAEEPGYAEDITDELQRSIARLMAQGLTDEVVARRLGMSVRTCRRHIAALLRNLDAVSRFQAGVQAAQRLAAGVA